MTSANYSVLTIARSGVVSRLADLTLAEAEALRSRLMPILPSGSYAFSESDIVRVEIIDVDTARVRARLADLYEPDETERWLASPHPQLGGVSGQQAIKDGRVDEVLTVLRRLEDGAYL